MLSLADFHGNISNISDSVVDDIMQLVEVFVKMLYLYNILNFNYYSFVTVMK